MNSVTYRCMVLKLKMCRVAGRSKVIAFLEVVQPKQGALLSDVCSWSAEQHFIEEVVSLSVEPE